MKKKYLLDVRSIEERNARSLALGKEKLSQGKTRQAMRLFAYNHALNQNAPKSTAPSGKPTTWKVRVWKSNKVVKTMTVEKDDEAFVTQKVKGLNIEWDKATVHDPKTMKQQKSYKNGNAQKQMKSTVKSPAQKNKLNVNFIVNKLQDMIKFTDKASNIDSYLNQLKSVGDYAEVEKELKSLSQKYKDNVVIPFEKISNDIFSSIGHDKSSIVYKKLKELADNISSLRFHHGHYFPLHNGISAINYV